MRLLPIITKAAILAAALSFCTPAEAGRDGAPALARSLSIGIGRDFYEGSESGTYLHGSTSMWEALTYLNARMEAVPWLAESWRSEESSRRWVFRLRENVLFHDGSPLEAHHVVASMRRLMKNPRYDPAGSLSYVEAVETAGDREIVFRLSKAIPHFPKLVAYYGSPVFKPECLDDEGRIREPIATGPYRLKSVRQGAGVYLSAFNEHWNGPPPYEEIAFMTIPDAQTRAMALISGQIDAIADVGGVLPEQQATLKRSPDVVVKKTEVATTHLLLFNCAALPFSSSEARRWVSGIIDRDKLISVFVKGAGTPARDPYTPMARDYAFGLIQPPKISMPSDLAAYKGEIIMLLHGGTLQRWPYREMGQAIQAMLHSYGLRVSIRIMEQGSFHDSIKSGRFHMAIQPYTLMTGDPDFFYSYWILSDAPRNCGWHSNEADILINEARHETDTTRRTALYRRLEEMLNKEMPLLPLYHDAALYAHRREIGGFYMDHFFKPCLTRTGCE
ncbi:MAG: ABC transporter substrate-binding protein [Desulfosoma sp.]|uniref:ABC transporter substrate-binding protein n=1 Tax=Desulfosoma sp. TaxID=2603217 RepID=UPI00404A2049